MSAQANKDGGGRPEAPPVHGKRIAVILYSYPLGVSTMLINSIALLARSNDVEVLIGKADRKAQPLDSWIDSHIVPYPDFGRLLPIRALRYVLRQLSRWARLPSSRMWWTLRNLDLYLFAGWLRRRCVRRNYDILIPIECFSLIAVDASGQMERDVIYYNMELLDWSAENPLYVDKPVLKALESRALLGVRHVMITSPERGKIFAGINSFPPARISALPVAPLRRPPRARSRYFRERFAIPDDRLILVYSGNFAPWAKCVEIIDGMGNWPANAVLVMHTWNGAAMSSAYFAQMREAAASKAVHFSSEFLLYDDLAPALSSADIGLMFYEAIDANFTEILFSSNKMAEYMAAGLPIICSPFPSLADFVHGERIGFTAGLDGIGPAASRIAADLETYRASVAECRRRHFEFERYFHEAFTAYADAPAR